MMQKQRVFTFLREWKSKDILLIIMITAAMYYAGEVLRPHLMLASFWPVNACLAGLFIRRIDLFNKLNVSLAYITLSLLDWNNGLSFSGAFLINLANILFVIAAVKLIYVNEERGLTLRIILRLFPGISVAAGLCATLGAGASVKYFNDIYHIAWLSWFSEELSTGMLIIPLIMTFTMGISLREFKNYAPVTSLILSVTLAFFVGGGASLTFTLPALIWCAVSYSLPMTVAIATLTGLAQIILVSLNVLSVDHSHIISFFNNIAITRIAVSVMEISPLICAVKLQKVNERFETAAFRANFDNLTKLHSRSGFYEQLKKRNDICAKNMSIFILDIDYFKDINDNYGHQVGDDVLVEFAKRIRKYSTKNNIIYRLGGEEFAIVMFDTKTWEQCYLLAEDIRQTVCSTPFRNDNQLINVTVSIGFAMSTLLDDITPNDSPTEAVEKLIAEADMHLYKAKRNGRNQVSPCIEPSVALKFASG